jgi:hypothetical protein
MVHLIGKAKAEGLHDFDEKIAHRLQHIFVNDNAELYVFGMSDILKMFRGFEIIDSYFNKEKVIEGIVELVLEGSFYEDEAFLEILKDFHSKGLIEKYQDLGVKARVYFQERFDYMNHKSILGYLELFKELGMLFEDKEITLLMKEHMTTNFHVYELHELL